MVLGAPGNRRAADDVGVAAEVLGRRMHDEVGAELQRALVDRRRERVVDGDERAALARHDAGDVDDVQRRVGRRLDPDQARLLAHRPLEGVEVRLVDQVIADPEARQDLVDEPVRAAVEVLRQDDVGAGLAHHGQQRVLRRQP